MNALLPEGYAEGPKHWQFETGGDLAAAMRRFLDSQQLTPSEIALIRGYLEQWVDSPDWKGNPGDLNRLRQHVREAETRDHLLGCIRECITLGMDPL